MLAGSKIIDGVGRRGGCNMWLFQVHLPPPPERHRQKEKREKGKRGGLLRRSVLMLIHDRVAIQSVDASGEQKSELTDLK